MNITIKEATGSRVVSLESFLMTEPYDVEREAETLPPCDVCDGDGGWDLSTDPEVYDNWEDCPYCLGSGENQND